MQLAWLEELLRNNPNRWTIVVQHQPIYPIAKGRDYVEMREALLPLYDKYRVDLVLQGHDHTYARTHKLAGGKVVSPSQSGTIYAISVSGPKMYEIADSVCASPRQTLAHTQAFQVIEMDGDKLTYDAYAVEGAADRSLPTCEARRREQHLLQCVGGVATKSKREIPAGMAATWPLTLSRIELTHQLLVHLIGEYMRYFRDCCIAVLLMLLAGGLAQAQKPSGYNVSRHITLGGDGGWDYLTFDGEARRLYVARATRVMVIDVDSGKPVGEIPNTSGVHGIALVQKSGRGVTSNGKDDSATIFDLKTLAPIATVKTGVKPDAILFDSFSGLVLTFNGKSNDTTLIDPEKAVVVETIALPGRPETGVSDGKGKVYVNLEDKSQIAVIDVAARKVLTTWPLTGCEEPTGLAIDVANRRLFSGCHNGVLVVVDAESGRNVQKLAIGNGVDATAYDKETGLVFTSNGEGNISVIRQEGPDKYTSFANAPTQKGAKTMALDASKHVVYSVANAAADAAGKPGAFELIVVTK